MPAITEEPSIVDDRRPGEPFEGHVRVRRFIFHAPGSPFAVAVARDANGEEVKLAGEINWFPIEQPVQVGGTWVSDPKYGPEVRVHDAYTPDPVGAEGARRFLRSIRNIGPRRADKLVQRYGADVLERIDHRPIDVFAEIKGMGEEQAREAADDWGQKRGLRSLYALLSPQGLARFAADLHRRLGEHAAAIVRAQPYDLTRISGIGFHSADLLAQQIGVPPDSPARAHAAVHHVLREAAKQGHSYLPIDDLVRRCRQELRRPVTSPELVSARGLVVADTRVFRREADRTERWVAGWLCQLADDRPRIKLELAPGDFPATPTTEQRAAVDAVSRSRISVITGGPGTGKTQIARAILAAARRAGLTTAACSPAGLAAQRLRTREHPSSTCHKLLEWERGGPTRSETNPIQADLILCDEAGFMPIDLARQFLCALEPHAHLVLIGDADQLAPVGPGRPFADLVDADICPVTRLTHVFRQAHRSLIVRAAHAVNAGEIPPTEPDPEGLHDFFFVERSDPARAADGVLQLVDRISSAPLPGAESLDPIRDVHVLSPIYDGPIGVSVLNQRLREQLNPAARSTSRRFAPGDRVIATKNDYEHDLRNGTLATVEESSDDSAELVIRTTELDQLITLTWDQASILQHGFATTVHRAIGAEVPVAIVVCHSLHHYSLATEILYTAITRAKKLCIVVGDRRGLRVALRRAQARQRHTALVERLRAGTPVPQRAPRLLAA